MAVYLVWCDYSGIRRFVQILTIAFHVTQKFSGHYGHITSEYAKNHLLNHVHERVSHDIVRNNLDNVESTLRTAIIDFDSALMGDILQKLQVFSFNKSLSLSNWSMDDDTSEFLGMKEDGENDPYAVYRRAAEGTTVLLSLLVKRDWGYEAWTVSLGDSDGCELSRTCLVVPS